MIDCPMTDCKALCRPETCGCAPCDCPRCARRGDIIREARRVTDQAVRDRQAEAEAEPEQLAW